MVLSCTFLFFLTGTTFTSGVTVWQCHLHSAKYPVSPEEVGIPSVSRSLISVSTPLKWPAMGVQAWEFPVLPLLLGAASHTELLEQSPLPLPGSTAMRVVGVHCGKWEMH